VHLISTSDRAALVREILLVAGIGKEPTPVASPDDSNIEKVVEIYEETR